MPDGRVIAAALLCGLAACSHDGFDTDPPIDCESCEAWNEPQAPFRVYGNTHYVGTAGLGSVLIDTGSGLILLDAGLPQSAALIEANLRELGFDARDIRFIAVSHAHYDHVGGLAAFVRASGATVLAGEAAVGVLERGAAGEDDPQFGPDLPGFPPVAGALGVDAETVLALGDVHLRAVPTPGHTPGGTSWTWQSCEAEDCLDVVYADSLSPVSAPGYRYGDGADRALRASAARIAALDCDIFLSNHDFAFGLHDKLAAGRQAFVDREGCRRYAEHALERLDRRLESEGPAP